MPVPADDLPNSLKVPAHDLPNHLAAGGGDADFPADVPMTSAQMRAAQEKTNRADETIKAIESTAPEPGLKHLLWSIVGAPLEVAVKGGQSALGERPLPTGIEGLAEAGLGVTAPVSSVAESGLRAVSTKAAEMKAREEARQSWTPEQIGAAAKTLGAPTAAKAQNIIQKKMNTVGPKTAQEAIDALNAARESGKPMMLPDVLPPAEKLAGRMYRSGGKASENIGASLNERNAGAVQRLTGDVNEAFGSEKAYDANQALMAARKAAAKPAYDEAYAYPPINPDEMKPDGAIGAFLERPSVKVGMANARKIAAEEGVDMNTLGIDLNEQGEPVLVRVPTWQTLDYMKRGIDNVVEQYRNPITGNLDLDTYGRVANITRDGFVSALRDMNPSYGKALDTWGGPSQSLDAIQVGRDALTREPELNAARFSKMSDSDKEFARLGVGQTLRDIANKRGPLAAEFDRVAGTQYGSKSTQDQLRPFFKDEAAMKKFIDAAKAETTMPRTANRVMKGSQTAERLATDEEPLMSGEDMAHAGISAALGHKTGLARAAFNLGQKLWDRRDPALNAELARILGSTGVKLARDPNGRIILDSVEPPP